MKAIDLQDNLSKAPLAAREQQVQQSGVELAQRQGAIELDRERIIDHSRTRATDEADGPQNRVDQPSRHGQDRERRRRQQRDEDALDDRPPPPRRRSDTSREIDLMA